jgi:outer membrane protein assembly factor BamB
VLEGVVADRGQVYFGSRDGRCYCLGRGDGKLRWNYEFGTPVIAAPALAPCSCCGVTTSVYVVSRGDPERQVRPRACCLDAATGRALWEHSAFPGGYLISTPVVAVEPSPEGDRRFVYFGGDLDGHSQVALYCLKDQWQEK